MLAKYAQELKSFLDDLDQWRVAAPVDAYKGLVLNNGQIHAWPVSECPYHETYMHRNNIYPDDVQSYHDINNGNHYSTRQEDKGLVAQALNLKPEQSWAF